MLPNFNRYSSLSVSAPNLAALRQRQQFEMGEFGANDSVLIRNDDYVQSVLQDLVNDPPQFSSFHAASVAAGSASTLMTSDRGAANDGNLNVSGGQECWDQGATSNSPASPLPFESVQMSVLPTEEQAVHVTPQIISMLSMYIKHFAYVPFYPSILFALLACLNETLKHLIAFFGCRWGGVLFEFLLCLISE
ncbi:unnamed protein product [Gongylonema pulchrum]|uniref:Uncharacterized protein n=1 Tax=Gongylonema pulchrum TaxID=637853 RepID=A0A183ELT7_9BILA|nr:unnamed protein product [Gongylonema pulchrum]